MVEFVMKRKAYDKMLRWKEKRKGSTALLIDGARRVGKSHLVSHFGKNEYRSHILIDFNRVDPEVKDIFERDSHDLDEFFFRLATFYKVDLHERESAIIFDEVQQFPKARGLIKYLVEDGRYDYIETGSLLSIKRNIQGIVLPSEEERLALHPMDFEEFLWAMGDKTTMPFLRDRFERLKPSGDAIHRRTMNSFRTYMIVGGMPQAVARFAKTRNLSEVDEIKRGILNLYREDVTRFAKGYEDKVMAVFDRIPAELSKKEKRFNLASLGNGAGTRSHGSAFIWLAEGGVVNRCFNSTDPSFGLAMNLDHATHKCYMADTGLLVSHSIPMRPEDSAELHKSMLFDKLGINEGMFMENIVAQMLRSNGHNLYFYSRRDQKNSKNTMEIDFLVRIGRKVCPVEVKSSNHRKHSSLDKFMQKFKGRVGQPYILYPKDLMVKDGVVHLPIYMAGLL
ncbi:MAG: ATP-binding protein [Thermoplasmatales archaeon]|nr:ATP-binding protein [Thermoplasmatales archaeon]